MKLSWLDKIALIILLVSGISWGLLALMDFEIIASFFGDTNLITKMIYLLFGVSSIYLIVSLSSKNNN